MVLIKASCGSKFHPRNHLERNDQDQCMRARRDSSDPIDVMLPVTDVNSGITYANSYCLRCNPINFAKAHLVYWSVQLDCVYGQQARVYGKNKVAYRNKACAVGNGEETVAEKNHELGPSVMLVPENVTSAEKSRRENSSRRHFRALTLERNNLQNLLQSSSICSTVRQLKVLISALRSDAGVSTSFTTRSWRNVGAHYAAAKDATKKAVAVPRQISENQSQTLCPSSANTKFTSLSFAWSFPSLHFHSCALSALIV